MHNKAGFWAVIFGYVAGGVYIYLDEPLKAIYFGLFSLTNALIYIDGWRK